MQSVTVASLLLTETGYSCVCVDCTSAPLLFHMKRFNCSLRGRAHVQVLGVLLCILQLCVLYYKICRLVLVSACASAMLQPRLLNT
jgi:hypothetical protein